MVARKQRLMAVLLGGSGALFAATNANAVPQLQLDIDGPNVVYNHVGNGFYTDETIMTTGSEFTIRALGLPSGNSGHDGGHDSEHDGGHDGGHDSEHDGGHDGGHDSEHDGEHDGRSTLSATDTVYLSIAVIPKLDELDGDNFGSFDLTFGGVTETIGITADMTWGIPPIALADDPGQDNLPMHGVFETYYTQRSYVLNTSDLIATPYNSQDTPGATLDTPGTGEMFVKLFDVVLNLNPGVEVGLHFDLFTLDAQGGILLKAPFSHDAEGGPGTPLGPAGQTGPPGGVVPEPVTATLGVMAMGALSTMLRRRR